ncbi:flagellar hook-associated protein FlgL [Rheinheimera salexigens]|uniref:Flagellar hook-associated protein 3 n=1 Tax=Rheinheimera salexigens TaxID=1628148 RepID=A0A1E7Q7Y2_9GAMM|nr:flagellar hook-associated protein FlgL [Rheinheimera salexigens]OEY70304.1 flagellar hook-associated protein 3 [Rheinheimera salexigens]
MRISFNMQFSQSLNGILDAQKRMSKAEEQLVKQTRILSPADDPAAAAKVLGLDQNLAQIEQFQKNSVLLKNNLGLEETVLTNMRTAYDRISTLAQAAGNGTYGPAERQALALELRNIQAEMFDAMNTTNADGSYIFAGYQDRTAAYEKDPVTGDYQFKGDDGFRALQISPSIKIPGNDSGKAIFDDVFARIKPLGPNLISGSPSSISIEVSAQNKLNAFYANNYDNLDPTNNTYNITIDVANNYTILQNGNPLTPAVSGTYVPGEVIEFQGLAIKIDGAAAAPGQIDFELPSPVKKNILNTLRDFIQVLENPAASSASINEAIGDALAQTEDSARRIDSTLSNLGGRNNVLNSVFNNNEDLTIKNKEYRADLAEVDFAAAMTEIKRQEVAMQAASSTFGKISASTLFDYIR